MEVPRAHWNGRCSWHESVEQNVRLALEISHRSYVFEIGKIALSGEYRSLSDDLRIRKAYLRT